MVTAPLNLEELQAKFNRINKGEDEVKLRKKSLDILRQMLVDPAVTSVKTIAELTDEFAVHRSSLTRLAQKLGFKGFPEFQSIFRREIKNKTSFYTNQVAKYLQRDMGSGKCDKSTIEEVSTTEWSNLLIAMENFDEEIFEAVADSLLDARRVAVLGLRASYSVAYFLGYYLKMIRDDVAILGIGGHILAEEIGNLHPGDVLLVISAAPYTKNTIDACQVAHDMGVEIVAMTDSRMSPLIDFAKHTLLASCKGNYFFTPSISLMIYAEAILSALIRQSGDVAINNLQKIEKIFSKMDYEIDPKINSNS